MTFSSTNHPKAGDEITRLVATLRPVLTLNETADVLRMSRRNVSREIVSGRLQAHKLKATQRGQVRITSEAIGDYLRATRA